MRYPSLLRLRPLVVVVATATATFVYHPSHSLAPQVMLLSQSLSPKARHTKRYSSSSVIPSLWKHAHISSEYSVFSRPIYTLCAAATNGQCEEEEEEKNKESPTVNLKSELTKYLQVRKQMGADQAMMQEAGKIVGGTRGNIILEFVSGSPNKEIVLDMPNVFDYSELEKYGFGYLVKPIMESGGRLEMYRLMGLVPPAHPVENKKTVPVIMDRTGQSDKGRYSGLKMKLVTDDSLMEQALLQANEKARAGQRMRSMIEEEDYQQPFADKRNVGPPQTPLWTAESLDQEGRKLGRAVDWARQAKAGAFLPDPAEILAIDGSLRLYSVITSLFVAFAFGRVTTGVMDIVQLNPSLPETLQPLAFAILVANLGSSIFGFLQAPWKNRSRFVWMIKGLLGGPVAVSQFSGLDILLTRSEQEQRMRDS